MRLSWITGALVCLAGCKSPPCATMPEMNALLAQAALVRVDVYDGAQAHCMGGLVEAQGAPLLSRTFPGAASLRLDIPPGQRTIALITFSDADGKMPSGSACTETDLAGGRGACLQLTLEPIDLDGGTACTPGNDTCPTGQFCASSFSCQSGCKTGADCTDTTKPKCEPGRHQCVACLTIAECGAGQVCSPSGVCTEECDPAVGCSGGRACCNKICVDTLSDPLNCNGCGTPCTGGDTLCCNGQCANPSSSNVHCGMCGNACSTLNGAPTCSAGVCTWTCNMSFVHCGMANTGCETASDNVNNCGGCGNVCTPTNANTNSCNGTACSYMCQSGFIDCVKVGANTDGCETSSNSVANCGACGRVCDTAHSVGADCPAGTCTYTGCMAGFLDCDMTNGNATGCECGTRCCGAGSCQPLHSNGLGQMYFIDTATCTPLGAPGDQSTYSIALATAARAAWTGAGAIDSTQMCASASCLSRVIGTECTVWCYTKMNIAGHLLKSTTGCTCPSTTDPTWN